MVASSCSSGVSCSFLFRLRHPHDEPLFDHAVHDVGCRSPGHRDEIARPLPYHGRDVRSDPLARLLCEGAEVVNRPHVHDANISFSRHFWRLSPSVLHGSLLSLLYHAMRYGRTSPTASRANPCDLGYPSTGRPSTQSTEVNAAEESTNSSCCGDTTEGTIQNPRWVSRQPAQQGTQTSLGARSSVACRRKETVRWYVPHTCEASQVAQAWFAKLVFARDVCLPHLRKASVEGGMARGSSYTTLLTAIAREAARSQREAEAARRRVERAQLSAIRESQLAAAAATKEAKQRYLDGRVAEVERLNEALAERQREMASILAVTLARNDTVDFEALRIREAYPAFSPPRELARPDERPSQASFAPTVRAPSAFGGLVPGAKARYERACHEANEAYEAAVRDYEKAEADRTACLERLQREHAVAAAAFAEKVRARDAEVDELKRKYDAQDPEAIVAYNTMVLERSEYPDGFPQEFRLAYVSESQQLVCDYELPTPMLIPVVAAYTYVKTKDRIDEKARKPAEIKDLYQDVVAAVALRTCHEVIEADQAAAIETIAFNGFVQAVDPATGRDIRPCLVSVRVTRQEFEGIDLARVDKLVCLRNLGAQVSPRPHEVQAVKPIVEFDMVDKRFVEQSDVLADLESRPNLMDLDPFEFENLIANLFAQIGLETRLTRSSRDGGVDVVAYDTRPVLGGKVVIQAKRYSNTVGVSAVRDLFGTMMNEGANKGILVATSGYGPDAFQFAKDKPIELIDGSQLLYLLEQVGAKARIVMPTEIGMGS